MAQAARHPGARRACPRTLLLPRKPRESTTDSGSNNNDDGDVGRAAKSNLDTLQPFRLPMAPSDALSSLEDVRRSGDVPTDVVLIAANGARVHTHALLCATISPVLRAALRSTSDFRESATRTVHLEYASVAPLEKMLSFACGGDLFVGPSDDSNKGATREMTGNDAMDLIQLADRLDIPSLKEACAKVLTSILTIEKAQDVYSCATASAAHDLAAKARTLLDARAYPNVIRSLHGTKRTLLATRSEKEAALKALKKELKTLESDIANTESKISFEMEKAYQEERKPVAAASTKVNGDALGEPYSHKPNRTLIVLPLPWGDDRYYDEIGMWDQQELFRSKRRKEIVETHGPEALVYSSLDEAIQVALPGDVIRLQKGGYAFPRLGARDKFLFNKSIQVVGEKGDTKISAWHDDIDSPIVHIDKCDVKISNVTFEAYDNEDMVEVSGGGRVWLEGCIFGQKKDWNAQATGISVGMGCSAYIRRCKADKIVTSAVTIDPQANEVIIDGCEFTRCGEGREGGLQIFPPGQCGAIEMSCKKIAQRDSHWQQQHDATAKVTIRNTAITSCVGPAVCYRVDVNIPYTSSKRRFAFPGSSSFVFNSNTIRSNGLSLNNPFFPYPDGEAFVRNNFRLVHERDRIKGWSDDDEY